MLPFPRFRLSLPVALLLIVLIAWNLWWLRAVLGLSRMVSTVTLEALDGDERALARDITSAPVLEHALSLMSMGKRCQVPLILQRNAASNEQRTFLATVSHVRCAGHLGA